MLAQIDTAASQDDFSAQLQSHLLEITRAYWELYLERANLLQKRRLLDAARQILQEMERRRDIDALKSQVVRASCGRQPNGRGVASRDGHSQFRESNPCIR